MHCLIGGCNLRRSKEFCMQKIIQIKNISKTYKKIEAVKNVSIDIFTGDSLALLGPNGAGKTTLVEMMEGLTKPDKGGTILIDGMQWKKNESDIRKIMGLSLQETRLIDRMKTREMLQLFECLLRARLLFYPYMFLPIPLGLLCFFHMW